MKSTKVLAFAALATMALAACNKTQKSGVGINPANMDTTVSPGENFYLYANGSWLKNNPIPASESRWGSFNELQEFNNKALRAVLEAAAAKTDAAKGSNEQKVGDFYFSGMDSAAIEQAGMSPLQPEMEAINSIKTTADLLKEIAHLQRLGVSPLFSFYVYIDQKKSDALVCYVNQGGLGLPDRDYYLGADERSKGIREEYVKHLVNVFKLMGDAEAVATKNAQTVMNMETQLAKASMTRVELRDPYATYNRMTMEQMNAAAPSLNFTSLLADMQVPAQKEIVVGQPLFVAEVEKQLKNTSIEDWKTYLRWNVIGSFSNQLSNAFVQEAFNFNGKVLNGTKELKPRWKRMIQATDNALGEALGEVYVSKYFSPEAKTKALDMVNSLADVYAGRIKNADWMAPETKTKALAKLGTFIKKIGYPDKWKDYSKLTIDRGPFVLNVIHANEWAFDQMVAKLNSPVDKMEWLMTPPTVNAYYNPSTNEITFPAGILQSPFFDANADDAVNYGGIGAVIGHEMTHGFDDQGRQYDADGNLKDWWTKEDGEKFLSKAKVVEEQFNGYTVLDSMHVNGKLTMGENIADLGGLSIALEAFMRTEQAKKNEKIDGLTPQQRFFISWAQAWRNNMRDEAMAQRIVTDPHSPGMFRANGPLTNMPEFYEAFGVKEGDKMFRPEAERAKIW